MTGLPRHLQSKSLRGMRPNRESFTRSLTIFCSIIVLSPSAAHVALQTKLLAPNLLSSKSACEPKLFLSPDTTSTLKDVPTNLHTHTASRTSGGKDEERMHSPTLSLVKAMKEAITARDSLIGMKL